MVNDTRREKTKRAIEAAMITLLKDQSFDEISTINL
ncbi:TetR/AcrR family transcriptional regulator, partial [Streptococcus agalactiae]|nr:TetR/AcrR family transcriptional regulator [Streptococcus agalactiae]MCK6302163.1 TetR/AcrR family transcriptional regulator [Streptococcus agalactiae]HEO6916566.1 TetR/AcrR family transcriptional regulator [Streptococcus agalactiae]